MYSTNVALEMSVGVLQADGLGYFWAHTYHPRRFVNLQLLSCRYPTAYEARDVFVSYGCAQTSRLFR